MNIPENWNDTESSFPRDLTLAEAFRRQAALSPEGSAVVSAGRHLTYQQLDTDSDHIAEAILRKHGQTEGGGLEAGTPIGVCLERGAEAISAILGILKAGGAYVPLDPEYPADRISYIANDARLPLIVTKNALLPQLSEIDGPSIGFVLTDRDSDDMDFAQEGTPPSRGNHDDVAYVLHTSGSSGDPKGVACTNSNAINFLHHMQTAYPLSQGDRCCLTSNLTFDVSVYETWSALLYGCTLYVPDRYTVFSPEDLFGYLSDHRIVSAYIPPFFAEEFARFVCEEGMATDMKRLLFGVEPIEESVLATIKQAFPNAHVINGYGPTEATICCCLYEVDGVARDRRTPVGRPFSNIKLYVVDEEMRPVADGDPGELLVSGACLARGYLNRPDLTERQFVANPFKPAADDEGLYSRVYLTGDMVMRHADGNLEFLGRKDRQLKIRGVRVEPGEVEAAVERHALVRSCVVVAIEEGGEKRLAAYFTGVRHDEEGPTPAELRAFVEATLTAHLVPSYFVRLEAFPMTAHGKVEIDALPKPGEEGLARREGFVAPRTEEEETLAAIFSEILKLETVGIHDNFFHLGGHSLTATRAAVRVQHIFGVRCPVRAVFDNPDIASLALFVREQMAEAGFTLTPIKRADRDGVLPLSFAQQRLWFLDQYEEAESSAYNLPIAFRLSGVLDIAALEKAIDALVVRHESLRTIFTTDAGTATQKVLPPAHVRLEPETIDENRLSDVLEREVHHRFDLERGPLFRVRLLKLGEREWVFVINQHHIISDAWSAGIMTREIGEMYEAFHAGAEPSLPELPVHYADYACWQREWLTGELLQEQVEYWREDLEGFPTVDLPADHPRPTAKTYNGQRAHFSLDSELTSALRGLCRKTDTTTFMVVLCALYVLMSRYTREEDVVIGTPVANRVHPDLENILGFFVNTLSLRQKVERDAEFGELLGRVKRTCLDAYANQDVPFEHLVDVLNVPRDISRTPIFQVMLVMQNVRDPIELDLGGIDSREIEITAEVAKFDLAVIVTEDDGVLEGIVEYNTDLFDPSTIERMISHFKTLLGSIVGEPRQRVGMLKMLTPDEERTVLFDWNLLHGAYPDDKTINQLFEEQVAKTPDAVAVVFEDERLTYTEVNERANRLARLLRSRYHESHGEPLAADTLIGICLERGAEMVVAMLAVLKAGGAYVPIDPDYPRERVSFMLQDSDVSLLIAQSSVLDKVSFMTLSGLGQREVDCVLTPQRAQIRDLDRLPLPDRGLIDVARYRERIGMAMVKDSVAIQASRGCPYQCAYCHKIWPKTHVVRSAEHIFSEIEHYRAEGVRRFALIDDIFNLDRKVSTRLFRMLIDSGLGVELFFPNGLRADLLSAEYIDLMVEAGTVSVALALESASRRVQKLIGKNLDLEKTRWAIDYFAEAHPEVLLELFAMIGFPSETEEEAASTLEFIEASRWIHFPYLHVLKVYPHTDMAALALEHGVSVEAINRSADLAFHELPDTLPYDKSFARWCQARLMNEYFLSKERLLATVPYQKRLLSEDEFLQKYNSYLPVTLGGFADFRDFCSLAAGELEPGPFREEREGPTPVPPGSLQAAEGAQVSVLLLDLSQHFSSEGDMLYDVVEEPLGLLYLAAYLRDTHGDAVRVHVAKSRIDFDSYEELKQLVTDFNPDIIGIRTLTFYRGFFHRALAMLKAWAPGVPVVAGGPYATSDYSTMLADSAVDLAVLGEGEATFAELVGRMLANDGRLPDADVLSDVAGLALASGGRPEREVILLDEAEEELLRQPREDLAYIGRPESVAYVIYTSGSTGTPKGVLVEHRNVVRLLFNEHLPLEFSQADAWTLFHSYCFDFSVWEMYGALLMGGRLVVVPRDVAQDTERFGQLLSREKITVLNQTPGAFYNLIRFAVEEDAPDLSLRYVIFGGEALNVAALEPWLEKYGAKQPELVNMFGITETCVHVTYCPLDARTIQTPQLGSPIGRALPDLSLYVLDESLKPAPIGVPGEMFVGGEGVARGYLDRPELTEERFLPNPFVSRNTAGVRNDRLYRTGDLARWRPGGVLEYMGRIDFQVKVRGFRVEPGEIESVLSTHPAVAQCIVAQLDDEAKSLVAYYVTAPDAGEVNGDEMKRFLSRKLPDYMVPQLLLRLDEMPLTAHGKIDRKALPVPGRLDRVAGEEYVAPRTEAEEKLEAIWREVLKLDRIGVNDDFFALGGDSIMSIQVVSRARRAGLRVSPKQLFSNPTIAGLAAVATPVQAARAMDRPAAEGTAPLSPIQRWFFEQELDEPHHFNQAFIIRPSGPLDIELLRRSLEVVAGCHDAFRLRFSRSGGDWEQRYVEDAGPPRVTEVDLDRGQSVSRTFEETCVQVQEGLDIENGPVALACIIREPGGRESLLLAVHHLVIDGVSWRFILEDLDLAYGQLCAGERPSLPCGSDSFKTWGERLEAWAKSGAASDEWPYWLRVRDGDGGAAVDFDKGNPLYEDIITSSVVLDRADTEALLTRLAGALGAGAEDVLLCALAMAFRKMWGGSRVMLHLEGHGREDLGADVDVTRTMGWFTSLYPVCLELPNSEEPRDLVKSVKERLRSVPHRGIGYGVLRYLSGDARARELEEADVARVSFNYLGRMDVSVGQGAILDGTLEPAPGMVAPSNRMAHLVEVWGMVSDGGLKMNFQLSGRHYESETALKLASLYEVALRELLAISGDGEAGGLAPRDFPLATISSGKLRELEERWGTEAIESIYGLAPLQGGLLFHSRYAPRSDQYVEQLIWRYDGKLDGEALKQAWEEIVAQHAVLRTAFVWDDVQEPVQVVLSGVDPGWREEDWRSLAAGEREARFAEYVAADRRRGFATDQPGLARFHVIRMGEEDYRFIWSHHHLLLDGWSMSLVVDELRERYDALVSGREPQVEPSPPFEEFVGWTASRDREEALGFWSSLMAPVEEPTPLAFSRTGSRLDTREPIDDLAELTRYFPESLTESCREFARAERVTLNSLIQLAWAVVLSQMSGRDDVVMGMTISGRSGEIEGVERMVGLLINTVPFPFVIGDGTAAEHLRRLHELVHEINENGFLPLTEIQGLSKVPASTPLFYSLFLFENYPVREQVGALAVKDIDFREKTNYPITMVVGPAQRMFVKISYDAGAFSPKSIERIAAYMESAVEWMIGHPDGPLASADIMPEDERALVLDTWTRNDGPAAEAESLVELFGAAAKKHPSATALTFRGESVTYEELDRKSDALAAAIRARYLSHRGEDMPPDTIVGLYADRSPEMVAGMLGAMKAGAAYLPIDTDYPDSRVRFLVADSRAGAVLAQGSRAEELRNAIGEAETPILGLDEGSGVAKARPARPGPRDLAYAIYTSGSTGEPKGVPVEHRSACNLVDWMSREYPLSPGDTVMQLTSFTFDVSVAEIFWTLSSGGRLLLAEPDGNMDVAYILRTIADECVDMVGFVPSLFSVFLEAAADEPGKLGSLEYVHVAGEALSASLREQFTSISGARLDNIYGPTEATVYSSFHRCENREPHGLPTVPIGRPVMNARLFVLDRKMRPVPPGVPGELHVGGACLARGYLYRPELTDERFVASPYAGQEEDPRLYKTGDSVRWMENGEIEFLGREDFQLKVRGFRVEPGEIEELLRRHPSVGQCVVVARGEAESRRLVAYFSPKASAIAPTPEELEAYLAERLPDYMVPSAFVFLDSLPLNPSGKLDRGALTQTGQEVERVEYVAPRDDLEVVLAGMFGEILGLETVGIDDDFFKLGGHSLLAARLTFRINRELELDLPVSAIFDRRTVRRLGGLVRERPGAPGVAGRLTVEEF